MENLRRRYKFLCKTDKELIDYANEQKEALEE